MVTGQFEFSAPTRRRQKSSVRRSKAGPPYLSPKDIQLVMKHDNLEILGGLSLTPCDQEPEQRSDQQVCER